MSQHSSSTTLSAFNGTSIEHVHNKPNIHKVVKFDDYTGVYDNELRCSSGVANADGSCVCQTSPNSTPFLVEHNHMNNLFVPEQPSTFSQVRPEIQCLMDERSPIFKKLPYEPKLNCKYP